MPSEEYKEENMRQVLVAAMRCFEEEGIYVTTRNKIAKKAGVTIRSVSRYYGTKDRLIAKALGYYQIEFLAGIRNFYLSSEYKKRTGYDRIKSMIEKRARDVKDYPRLTLSVKEMEVYLISNNMGEELCTIYDEYFAFMRSVIVGTLQQGLNDQSISPSIDIEKNGVFLAGGLQKLFKNASKCIV
ncbi:TetR/AcrR family transcriptional regulator [Eubacterium aggregans]|uniref:TetR/AcrR family transcriptional regulator n=1 Tax=Eubacterium aggregans TaxID=81409 RepID=UPI003F33D2DE